MGERDPSSTALSPGHVLCGRFRIVRFIARGGMGEVYEARDLELGESIALKTVRSDIAGDEDALRRFRREIQLARRVTHRNVCRIFDLFEHREGQERCLFLTMELLGGETLGQRLRRVGKLSGDEALPLARQLAAGLTAAHQAGVIHRDLKSENVFLVPGADGERAVITDFGLAVVGPRTVGDEPTATLSGLVLGTPAYMAPEQIEGKRSTAATDVYALGIILFEMVTGARPFPGANPISAAVRRLTEPAPSARRLTPELALEWDSTIARCLERRPARRFASAEEVVESLAGRPVRGRPSRRIAAALGLAAAVAVAALGWWWHGHSRGPEVEPRPTVAVVGFRNLAGSPRWEWLGTALGEMLGSEISLGEQLRLIPGEDVARARLDLELSQAEIYSAGAIGHLRELLGSDLVVLGSYLVTSEAQGASIRVDLRIQETEGGKVVATLTESGVEEKLLDLVERVGARLRRSLGVAAPREDGPGLSAAGWAADPEAARLWAEGLEHLWLFDAIDARHALEAAVEIEPDFPLARAALAEAWALLGHGDEARQEAARAFELSSHLPREARLLIEARLRECDNDWPAAIDIYRSLWTFFPDNSRYGLALAEAQLGAGEAAAAAVTVEAVRSTPGASDDPRIDLCRARVCRAVSDYETQLELARKVGVSASRRGARQLLGHAQLTEGRALWRMGSSAEAVEAYAEAGRTFHATGDRRGEARTLIATAETREALGELDAAEGLYREALGISTEVGDVAGEASALLGTAGVLRARGDLEAALHLLDEARSTEERTGNRRRVARVLRETAMVHRLQGDLETALDAYRSAYRIVRECGDQSGATAALNSIAIVERQQGNMQGALDSLAEVLRVKREIGDRREVATPLVNLANVHLDLGGLEQAETLYRQALELGRELGSTRHTGAALFGLGEVALLRADLAGARHHHEQALSTRRAAGQMTAAAASELALAVVEIEEGRAEEARQRSSSAAAYFTERGISDLEAYARAVSARAALASGDGDSALEAARRATALAEASEDLSARLFVASVAGRVEALAGDEEVGRSTLRWCLEEAARTGLATARLEALIALGEVEAAHGDPGRARGHLRAARALAAERGLALLEQRAARLLAQL